MPLFNLNPKESAKELFGRESELDELVHLIKARRWVAVLGSRISVCFLLLDMLLKMGDVSLLLNEPAWIVHFP